jgi:hypothetical protein
MLEEQFGDFFDGVFVFGQEELAINAWRFKHVFHSVKPPRVVLISSGGLNK